MESTMKRQIKDVIQDRKIAAIIDWELHPFDAVARYMEWGNNWSRGLDHAKSCGEECAYFKINALHKPARLLLVRHSHKNYAVISEIDAPQELIDDSVKFWACHNAACGLNDELRRWLRKEAEM